MRTDSNFEKQLKGRMEALGIFEQDLEETFVRSSGPGGQNVNKVATCVCLKHLPTGIIVKSQATRSQGQNRFTARLLLIAAVNQKKEKEAAEKIRAFEKLRRQKRKRTKAVKEKMLEGKRQRSERKKGRSKIKNYSMAD